MDYTTATLFLAGVTLLVIYFWNSFNYWQKCGVPSVKGVLPVIGNMFSVLTFRKSFSEACMEIYKKYRGSASMVGFYNMGSPTLLVMEPELVKTVLQSDFSSFQQNGPKIDPAIDPLLAKDPFFNDGEVWSAGRKRLQHMFTSGKLRLLLESITEVCKKFDDFLDKKLKSCNKVELELKDLFSKYTGEVVANAGMGIEGNCFTEEKRSYSFQELGNSFLEPTIKTAITLSVAFFFPCLNKILSLKFVPKRVEQFFETTVKEVLDNRRKQSFVRNDFLQLSLELEKTKGERINVHDLTGQVFAFFLDGYETSSVTLSFLGYHLAVHQDIQEKLRQEVMRVYSEHNDQITYEGLRDMKYMDQVLCESQRHYPALGTLLKVCTEEYKLVGSDGVTCHIKPGVEVCVSVYGMHMDPTHWPNPETFDPERFNDENKQDIPKFTFLPFGEGPRRCVGMRLAILQMKACMATLLLKYKLDLSPKTKEPLKMLPYGILSYPIGGIWVNVTRI